MDKTTVDNAVSEATKGVNIAVNTLILYAMDATENSTYYAWLKIDNEYGGYIGQCATAKIEALDNKDISWGVLRKKLEEQLKYWQGSG